MNQEKKLILAIKIVPIIIIVLFAIFATLFSIYQNNQYFENKMEKLRVELIEKNKQKAKEETLSVYNTIKFEKNDAQNKLEKNIKERVDEAYAIANRIYLENKNKNKTVIIKMIKDALRDIRFNSGRGYYFIYKMDGTNILLPSNENLEGKNFWDFKDAKGVYTIRGMANLVKEKDHGFYTWWWYKPEDNEKQHKKIGYGKYFEPFDWFIGTGEYLEDFENDIKKTILNRVNNYKYGKNGYIFIFDYDGLTLSHIKKEYRGVNRINLQDPSGYMIIKNVIKTAQEGDGFINYIGTINPTTGKPAEKISYIKGFDEWRWAIGSGTYNADIYELIKDKKNELVELNKKEIDKIIIIGVTFTFIFVVVSFILSNIINNIFHNYKKRVSEEVYLNKQKDIQMMEQSKLASMGEMIGNIAHQWRQPLSVISTSVSGISAKYQYHVEVTQEEIIKCTELVMDQTQYLSNTIDDFRNFIKGDNEKKKFKIVSIIEQTLSLVNASLKNHYIEVVLDLEDDLEIEGFSNELMQVFINMLNNGKDALLEQLESDEEKYIFITTKKVNDGIQVIIKDNAKGIKPDVITRIFEPYFTTKHQNIGTGLGLSMSYKIITKKHNGKIEVQNTTFEYNGKKYTGAEFCVFLK